MAERSRGLGRRGSGQCHCRPLASAARKEERVHQLGGKTGSWDSGFRLGKTSARVEEQGQRQDSAWGTGRKEWGAGGAVRRGCFFLPSWGDLLVQKTTLPWYLLGTHLGQKYFDFDVSQIGFWIPEGRAFLGFYHQNPCSPIKLRSRTCFGAGADLMSSNPPPSHFLHSCLLLDLPGYTSMGTVLPLVLL